MPNRIHNLIIKALKGELTPKEQMELDAYKARSQEAKEVVEALTDPDYLPDAIKAYSNRNVDAVYQRATGMPPVPAPARVYTIGRYLIAAAVIIGVVCLAWMLLPKLLSRHPEMAKTPTKDEFYKGTIKKGKAEELSIQVDTLETQYQSYYSQQLPDGSTVWLNCASSLLIPKNFSGSERVVQLEGEAFFEIAKDKKRPFKVQVSGMEIIVTGTKFNVKAYSDEDTIRTTLVEGSVEIKTNNGTDTLKKLEQALLTSNGKLKKNGANSFKQATLAWKKNEFDWDQEHMETIIRDICHWHGLKPDYRTNVSYGTYSATISRKRPLYQTLAILERVTPYKFQVENQTLIIRQR